MHPRTVNGKTAVIAMNRVEPGMPRVRTSVLVIAALAIGCSQGNRSGADAGPAPSPSHDAGAPGPVATRESASALAPPLDGGQADAGPAAPAAPKLPGLIGSGREYRYALSGSVGANGHVGHVIALREVNSAGLGTIDVLSTSGDVPPVTLTTGPTADTYSIKVPPRSPEALVYLDHLSPRDGLGTVMYADLEQPKPVVIPIPEALRVPEEGLHLGATGKEVLFLAQYDETTAGGKAYWWGGAGQPVLIGGGSPFRGVVFSRDRSVAVVGVNLERTTGFGDLVYVEMANGHATPIAQGVALLSLAYKSIAAQLESAQELAFSLTGNGKHVVFATRDGTVKLWSPGKPAVVIAENGRFPSVSEDGRSVAFFTDGNLALWSNGRLSATVPAGGEFTPQWSPDGKYVAFLTRFLLRGAHPTLGNALGDVSVLPAGSSKAVPWATNAAWRSVRFWPQTGSTKELVVFGNVRDLTDVPTLDQSVGDVFAGPPGDAPKEPVARAVRPGSYKLLPLSGGVVFTWSPHPFSPTTRHLGGIWTPKLGREDLFESAVDGSFQTAGDRSQFSEAPPSYADESVILTDPEPTLFQATYPVAQLMSLLPGKKPAAVKDHVLAVTFANDGRILALTPETGSTTNTDLWILPFQP